MPPAPCITLIRTYEAAAQATSVLTGDQRILVVDCEGHNLGQPHGSLTLISLGTHDAAQIFLLDVLALPDPSHPSLAPLLSLLSNRNVLKIFWDGRTDVLEIRETYGIAVEGILDLQVVEVVSREYRISANRRLKDLVDRYFKPIKTEVLADPSAFEGIYQLVGLDMCMGYLRLFNGSQDQKDPEVVALHQAHGSEVWLRRPLSDKLLNYAAHDIVLIARLHGYFTQQKWWKGEGMLKTLREQSAQYVSIYRTREMKKKHQELHLARFMTLGILRQSSAAPESPLAECQRCHLQLNLSCYHLDLQQSQDPLVKPLSLRWSYCRLCSAIVLRNKDVHQGVWVSL